MEHKINKRKRQDNKQDTKERKTNIKDRLHSMNFERVYSLDERIDFGKYKSQDCSIREVIRKDSAYVQWALENKILRLDKEAFDFFAQTLRDETQAEFDRIRKENAERDQRERERRDQEREERDKQRERQRRQYDEYSFNDTFDRVFHRQQKAEVVEKIISPDCQWDNLPKKQKYGSILRLQEVMENGAIKKESIKKQYFKLMLEYHPDKVADRGELIKQIATEMTVKINAAWDYFRKVYDI